MSLLMNTFCVLVVLSVIGNDVSGNPQVKEVLNVLRDVKDAVKNSGGCSEDAGCHNGYCWAWCGLSLSNAEWCYTTEGSTYDFQYVRCQRDSDCQKCWRCAGPCALF